jgi:hypothetical protein
MPFQSLCLEGVACLAHNYLNPGRGCCCGFRNPKDQVSAWERGSNENAIGLVRHYFPKKQSFDNITNEDTELVM